jgi:hypothetical protein
MTFGTRSAPVDALRSLLTHSVRFGALSLSEAAMTEAAIATSCGGPGFALRLAAMQRSPQVALVRSSAAGRRGALLHAFLILDDTSGHQADWIVGDVRGILSFGDAARRWDRADGRLLVDHTPDDVQEPPGDVLTAAVARRLPWLSGLAIATGAQPVAYAVADLARIGRIIQRCPEASIEARLKDFDRTPGRDGPTTEDAAGQDIGIVGSLTPASGRPRAEQDGFRRAAPRGRPVDASTYCVGTTPVGEHPPGVRP